MILDLCNCAPETTGCSSSIPVHEGLEETHDDIWLYVLAHLFYVTHIAWKLKAHKNEIQMCLFHACQKHSSLLNRDIVLQNTASNICFKIWSIPSRSYGKHIPWYCPFQIMYLLKAFSNYECCRSGKISDIKLHYGLSSSGSHDFFERHHLFAVLINEDAKESATWKMKLIHNSSIMSDKQFRHKL